MVRGEGAEDTGVSDSRPGAPGAVELWMPHHGVCLLGSRGPLKVKVEGSDTSKEKLIGLF